MVVGQRKQLAQRSSATALVTATTNTRRGVHAAKALSLGADFRMHGIHARLPRRALLSHSLRLCALPRAPTRTLARAPLLATTSAHTLRKTWANLFATHCACLDSQMAVTRALT